MTTIYYAAGSVRGECGHAHRTLAGADGCCERDHRGCRAHGGRSDRAVYSAPRGAGWHHVQGERGPLYLRAGSVREYGAPPVE